MNKNMTLADRVAAAAVADIDAANAWMQECNDASFHAVIIAGTWADR